MILKIIPIIDGDEIPLKVIISKKFRADSAEQYCLGKSLHYFLQQT